MSLSGKTIVFTNTFTMTRVEATKAAESAGAKVDSSVTTNTSILVAGQGAGAVEEDDAKAKGVEIWTEDQFVAAVGGGKEKDAPSAEEQEEAPKAKKAKHDERIRVRARDGEVTLSRDAARVMGTLKDLMDLATSEDGIYPMPTVMTSTLQMVCKLNDPAFTWPTNEGPDSCALEQCAQDRALRAYAVATDALAARVAAAKAALSEEDARLEDLRARLEDLRAKLRKAEASHEAAVEELCAARAEEELHAAQADKEHHAARAWLLQQTKLIEDALYLDAPTAVKNIQHVIASRLNGKCASELCVLLGADRDFGSAEEGAASIAEPVFVPEGFEAPPQSASSSTAPPALLHQPPFLDATEDAMEAALGLVDVATIAELKGVDRVRRALARRVLCARFCRRDGQPVPTLLDAITDLDVEQLIEAGRPGDAAIAGRMVPGLARLHGYGHVVDVAAIRAANLDDEEDNDVDDDMDDEGEVGFFLLGTAKDALNSCISGEGEPPLELAIAAVACAGLGVVCGIPVQQMREDSVTAELDLSDRGLHVAAAMLVAYLLPATSVLKKCNLLKNSFDIESATMLAKIGADKGIMLTSMTRDQTKADLSGQDLQPADTILIGSDLKFMTVLTDLSLGNNCIGPEGAKAIMGALSSGTSAVTNLELHGNDIGDEGSIAIAEALHSGMSVVTSLNLRYNQIGKEGAIAIAKALKSGTSVLITLHLGSNNIGDDGARAIAGALSSGTAVLTTLGLGSNKISDDGAKAIAGALSSGTAVLTELRMAYNNIGDDGAKAIADSLNSGTAVLTTLRLDTNKIGDEGAKAIAGALSSGTGVLTKLWLGSNSMGDAGKQALQDAVKDRSGFMLHL